MIRVAEGKSQQTPAIDPALVERLAVLIQLEKLEKEATIKRTWGPGRFFIRDTQYCLILETVNELPSHFFKLACGHFVVGQNEGRSYV